MRLTEFAYDLPKELIAQFPCAARGEERLLVLDKKKKDFTEKTFSDIIGYFKRGDLLVLNDAKVIPARLFGRRKTGGKVEIFIIDKAKNPVEALVRPSARIKNGEEIILERGYKAKILDRGEIGRFVEFDTSLDKVLSECGHVPLPPYIDRPDQPIDKERYQTVYASSYGATASPTAGLHFTEEMIARLVNKGVDVAHVTLHVSYGTFAPIKKEDVDAHRMHSEHYLISDNNIRAIKGALNRKARIFACGTTSLRALEASSRILMDLSGDEDPVEVKKSGKGIEGYTSLFIYPGYKFKIVDALITNFHLPKSTLILLTSAFAGKEFLFEAYEYAIERKFKFFSYGDAMLIV